MKPEHLEIITAAGWVRCEHPQGLTADMWTNPGAPICVGDKFVTERAMLESAHLIKFPLFLFVDTETTGLPAKDGYNDATHPETPRLVELGAVLKDSEQTELARFHCLVKPEGWTIHPDAAKLHGITQEMAEAEGLPLWRAMWELDRLVVQASALVMHNHQFDRLVLKGAHHLLGVDHQFRAARRYCTMMSSTKICQVPYANGRGGFKWPTLQEAHKHFLGAEYDEAHGAIADAEACSRVFFAMKAAGHVKFKEDTPAPAQTPAA